ncbi:hypothetical protein KSP40_PGU021764 [Platanthera guangdongensis]|uniref:J domain-containing protein n=1 Tax=Platanthera guangdongensis TaxID=2320717 RepID=A0ABR2M397_9ASPA
MQNIPNNISDSAPYKQRCFTHRQSRTNQRALSEQVHMITAPDLSLSLPISRPHFAGRRIAAPLLSWFPHSRPRKIVAAVSSKAERTSNIPPPPPPNTLYDVLGLSEGATVREIRSAYRIQARACHPDAAASTGSSGATADDFLRLHAAYSILSDPTKRGEYDRELNDARMLRRSPPRVYRFSGKAPQRTWETDQCW